MKFPKTIRFMLLIGLLALSLTAVTSGTIAWFTDSVESSGNIVASGNLDVEMWVSDDGTAWTNVEEMTGKIFDYDKWEPGYVQTKYIKIVNNGNLAFEYGLNFTGAEKQKLAEVIDVYKMSETSGVTRDDVKAATPIGTLKTLAYTDAVDGILLPAGSTPVNTDEIAGETIFCLALKMQESAGNEYQGQIMDAVDVKLEAKQYIFESDSFDKNYDADAEYAGRASTYEQIMDALSAGNNVTLSNDIDIPNEKFIGVNGSITTVPVTLNLGTETVKAERTGRPAFYAKEGGQLTINGNGTVETSADGDNYSAPFMATSNSAITVNGGTYIAGATTKSYHSYVQNSATLIINDGTFIATEDDAALLYCINGFIEINGGYFENKFDSSAPLLSVGNNIKYINNQKITLRGGTFVNWNPMTSAFAKEWQVEGQTVPAMIVLDSGYKMTSETQTNGDIWYIVVAE